MPIEPVASELAAKVGGQRLGDGERVHDELCVDRNGARTDDRDDGAHDDGQAEDFMVRVEQEAKRKRNTKESCKSGTTSMMGASARAE